MAKLRNTYVRFLQVEQVHKLQFISEIAVLRKLWFCPCLRENRTFDSLRNVEVAIIILK